MYVILDFFRWSRSIHQKTWLYNELSSEVNAQIKCWKIITGLVSLFSNRLWTAPYLTIRVYKQTLIRYHERFNQFLTIYNSMWLDKWNCPDVATNTCTKQTVRLCWIPYQIHYPTSSSIDFTLFENSSFTFPTLNKIISICCVIFPKTLFIKY